MLARSDQRPQYQDYSLPFKYVQAGRNVVDSFMSAGVKTGECRYTYRLSIDVLVVSKTRVKHRKAHNCVEPRNCHHNGADENHGHKERLCRSEVVLPTTSARHLIHGRLALRPMSVKTVSGKVIKTSSCSTSRMVHCITFAASRLCRQSSKT